MDLRDQHHQNHDRSIREAHGAQAPASVAGVYQLGVAKQNVVLLQKNEIKHGRVLCAKRKCKVIGQRNVSDKETEQKLYERAPTTLLAVRFVPS